MNKFVIFLLVILFILVGNDYVTNKRLVAAQSTSTKIIKDITPPKISAIKILTFSDNKYRVTWQTDEPTYGKVTYWVKDTSPMSELDARLLSSHSIELGQLLPDIKYNIEVESRDSAGNKTTSEIYSFTTIVDNSAPVISDVVVATNVNNSVVINWKTNKPTKCLVQYKALLMTNPGSDIDNGCISQCTQKYPYQIQSRDRCAKECTNQLKSDAEGYSAPVEEQYDTGHSVLINNFQFNREYIYVIQAEDTNGNKTKYENRLKLNNY
jgi:hypothetical protein